MLSHYDKFNELPDLSAVYTPVQFMCIIYDKIIVNIANAAYIKVCHIVGKIY